MSYSTEYVENYDLDDDDDLDEDDFWDEDEDDLDEDDFWDEDDDDLDLDDDEWDGEWDDEDEDYWEEDDFWDDEWLDDDNVVDDFYGDAWYRGYISEIRPSGQNLVPKFSWPTARVLPLVATHTQRTQEMPSSLEENVDAVMAEFYNTNLGEPFDQSEFTDHRWRFV